MAKKKGSIPVGVYGGLLMTGWSGISNYNQLRKEQGWPAMEAAVLTLTGYNMLYPEQNTPKNVSMGAIKTWGGAIGGVILHKTVGKYVNPYLAKNNIPLIGQLRV